MDYKRLVLVAIVLGECTVGTFWGYRLWNVLRERKNVLGAQIVTRINKDALIFPKDGYLSYYFEPRPYSEEVVQPDWLGYTVKYKYNADGIRDDKEYSIDKPHNIFRIITLGDSFTFGMYVNAEDTYSSKLAGLLNAGTCGETKFEVMNFGVGAYDIEYAVEHFRRRGQKYQPDLVLWLVNEHNVLQLRDLLTPLEKQIRENTSDEEKRKLYAENKYYFATGKAQELLESEYGDGYIFARQNDELDKFSKLYKGPLALYMFSWSSAKTRDFMKAYTLRRPDTYFDGTLPDIGEMNGALPDGHPNAQGHTIIANTMYQYLLKQKLVPCP